MSGFLKTLKKLLPVLRNKFILSFLVFVLWIIFFDTNNLIDRSRQLKELHELEEDKAYYLKRIENDTKRMNELRTDRESLEKFAREQYLMKKKNEDLFIIVEK